MTTKMDEPSGKAVVILSGGLDSSTLLHYVTKTLGMSAVALTVDYGQRHEKEIECARQQVEAVRKQTKLPIEHLVLDISHVANQAFRSSLTGVGDVPDLDDVVGHPQPSTYVPFRNLFLLTLGAAVAESHGADGVYYGAQSADLYGYWDTTPEFVRRLNDLFSLNRGVEVGVIAPFLMMKKWDIVRLGSKLGVDFELTWSCYRGNDKACGTCATCRERRRAFAEVGLEDPLEYEEA